MRRSEFMTRCASNTTHTIARGTAIAGRPDPHSMGSHSVLGGVNRDQSSKMAPPYLSGVLSKKPGAVHDDDFRRHSRPQRRTHDR